MKGLINIFPTKIIKKCLLIFCRSTHEVVSCEGTLLALGGNDGSSSLNSVERYDPRLNKWTIVTSMLTRRSSVGAAMLECFNIERGLPVVAPVKTIWRWLKMNIRLTLPPLQAFLRLVGNREQDLRRSLWPSNYSF